MLIDENKKFILVHVMSYLEMRKERKIDLKLKFDYKLFFFFSNRICQFPVSTQKVIFLPFSSSWLAKHMKYYEHIHHKSNRFTFRLCEELRIRWKLSRFKYRRKEHLETFFWWHLISKLILLSSFLLSFQSHWCMIHFKSIRE